MPELPNYPKLIDYQKYVTELEKERGFDRQDVITKCLLLGEEIGELFKSIRKQTRINIDPESKVNEVAEELADVFIMLCAVANRMDVNLETAFREKEAINKKRVWK